MSVKDNLITETDVVEQGARQDLPPSPLTEVDSVPLLTERY